MKNFHHKQICFGRIEVKRQSKFFTLRIVPPTPSFRTEFLFGSETFAMLNQRTDLVNRQLVPSPKVSCFSYF